MKISYNWLKQYIDFETSPEELSPILTDTGLEVEGMEKFQSIKGGLEGVIVGEVKKCEKHPNADKLSVTEVDVGDGRILPVVCGAPNVAAGQKVLVATVGTKLYAGDEVFTIKKAKIRGEVSEGMICAEDELGLGTSHDGIMVLNDDAQVGTEARKYFRVEEDVVFEIGLTPNRTDATSHIGTARDLVAALNRLHNTRDYKLNIPSVARFEVDNHDLDIEVIVEDNKACPRYTGVTISGVHVSESPDWLKNKLNALGLRPINNVVDITNYVLHETGQPLHAFDAAGIAGNKVIVKKLPESTPFITLDEEERKLHSNDLMICNEKEGMCIAGVFGGATSGVTEKTKDIFLESAYFDPTHIRKTSKRHMLQTDASFRFERGADPNITEYALKRAAILIKEVAGGTISSEIKDVYPDPIEKWPVDLAYKNVDRLIGKKIDRQVIKDILTDLELEVVEETADGLRLLIPTFKADVTRDVDVIEEIIRIYGYNNIEFSDKIYSSVQLRARPDREKLQNMISDYLTSQGLSEIMNNSLTKSEYAERSGIFEDKNSVYLLNPLSQDLNVLRQTLLFGGLEVVAYNLNRKVSNLKLYEFGKVYRLKEDRTGDNALEKYHEEKHLMLIFSGMKQAESWNAVPGKVDLFDVKALVEGILEKLGIERDKLVLEECSNNLFAEDLIYKVNNDKLVEVGSVSKKQLDAFDIRQGVFSAVINWDLLLKHLPGSDKLYEPVARYPEVRRDLALLLDTAVKFNDLKNLAFSTERKLLKSVGIFDIYQGDKIPEGKKSYALSFILQDKEKTLNDKVIDKAMKRIQMAFEQNFGAELR
ncbi:MAG TPA: phenylalanine--tRNA ligase subunit beta [Bacteroidetes bacterium]|nr:phenylalanine--tRNA ligase subunit beta [Bacteroidota bacterium]